MYLICFAFVQVIYLLLIVQAYRPVGYLGCFEDTRENRTLPMHFKIFETNGGLACKAHCSYFGYRYAGTEYGSECWCGSHIRMELILSENQCNIPCRGNRPENCGGMLRISVFDTWILSSSVQTETHSTITPTSTRATYANTTEGIIKSGIDSSLLPIYVLLPVVALASVLVIVVLICRRKFSTGVTKCIGHETDPEPNIFANLSIIDSDILGNTHSDTSLQNAFENITAYTEVELNVNGKETVRDPTSVTMDTEYNTLNVQRSNVSTPANTYDHTSLNTNYLEDNTYSKTSNGKLRTQEAVLYSNYSHIEANQHAQNGDATYNRLNGEIYITAHIADMPYNEAVTQDNHAYNTATIGILKGNLPSAQGICREIRTQGDKLESVPENEYDTIEEGIIK